MTNLLIYRFVIFNAVAIGLMVWLHGQGFVRPIIEGDKTFIVFAIMGVFLLAFGATAFHVARTSLRLNRQKRDGAKPATMYEAEKAGTKLAWLGEMSEHLFLLGIIGTVIGFSIALGGIDINSLLDASGVQSSVTTLMAGMKVAIYTTIVGSVLGLWHSVNWRMLDTADRIYWCDRLAS